MKVKALFSILALFLACTLPQQAQATACIPGLPCVTPLTAFDPLEPGIAPANPGPNTTGLNANKSTVGSCDADFMNQIYGKAYTEAERETLMNDILIRKPDSVLEYTCFDQQARYQWDFSAPILTENPSWNNITIPILGWWGEPLPVIPTWSGPVTPFNTFMGNTYHDGTLETLILSALDSYIGQPTAGNFYHSYLGGYMPGAIDNTLEFTASAVGNICTHMYDMHYLSKCLDFDQNLSFLTFDQLIALQDPRVFPAQCQTTDNYAFIDDAGETHSITQDLVDLARNAGYTYASFDPVQTYIDLTTYYINQTCEPPIETGLQVFDIEYGTDIMGNTTVVRQNTYLDMVCPNPSCYLDANGGQCLQ